MKFFVPGEPAAKGSTVAFQHRNSGKVITRQGNAKKLYPWQQAIGYVAKQAGVTISDDPVIVNMVFFLKKPKKSIHEFPARPDLDKLCRSCLDALTGIAYLDDKQVCELKASKAFDDGRGIGVEIELE